MNLRLPASCDHQLSLKLFCLKLTSAGVIFTPAQRIARRALNHLWREGIRDVGDIVKNINNKTEWKDIK